MTQLGPIIADLEGGVLTHEEATMLKHPNLGGLILFSRNYEDRQQLAHLIQQVRAIRPELILCVDQEGGRVQRLQHEFTRLPPLSTLGQAYEKNPADLPAACRQSEALGYLMASEVRAVDLDLSFAPVLDIDKGVSEIMRDRAFHTNPEIVAALALAYIQGMHRAGMKATGKHFPGHGHVVADSHLELPVDARKYESMTEDMLPFKHLLNTCDAFMTAHILFPEVDSLPTSFSAKWLKDILRETWGYSGVIVSDDLSMKATNYLGDMLTRAQLALGAGCDFVLICNDNVGARMALEGINDKADKLTFERRERLRGAHSIELETEKT